MQFSPFKWIRQNGSFFLLTPKGGYRKGEAIINNLVEVAVRFDPARVSASEAEEFINKLEEFLKTELDKGKPLSELQEDAYEPGGPLSSLDKPQPLELMARVMREKKHFD